MKAFRIFTGFACNNSCRFCDQEAARLQNLPAPDLKPLIQEAVDRGAQRITFCGGETTVAPQQLVEGAREARRLGVEDLGIFTNGRMLGYEKLTSGLIKLGVGRFDISLHGVNQLTHEWITQVPGSFLQTLSGIRETRRLGAEVTIHMVLLRSNFRQLGWMPELAARLKVSAVHIRFVAPEGAVLGRSMPSLIPKYNVVRPHLEEAVRAAEEAKLPLFIHDVPDCQLGSLVGHAVREKTIWIGLPADVWERSERFYAEVCEGCSAREICPGTTPTYAEYYTVDELVAL
jgi:MoaA/NifB/PqqE/SkfB family radical SAM enzyme